MELVPIKFNLPRELEVKRRLSVMMESRNKNLRRTLIFYLFKLKIYYFEFFIS